MHSTPIKVAQCLAGADHGGAEKFYTRLVCALANNKELQQQAFTRNNKQRVNALRNAGVPVETFRFGSALNIIDHWNYRRALRAFSPQVVLSFMNRASKLTPAGPYRLACRLGHYYNLKYYRHADYWIGNTRGICDHLVAGGMPANRVFLIQNFADETPVETLPRDSFNTPADRPLIVAAGRLHVNKGFDVLLHALQDVPDAILWLAGTGPEDQALRALATQLGVAERVRFLGWRDDVTALIATGDIFVCPSRHEGIGSIILEAWSQGCPIVATNSQGPGEIIEHGETGLITPIDQAPALAAGINGLLNDSRLRENLATAGKSCYQKRFSQQVISDQYSSLFKDIASRPKP